MNINIQPTANTMKILEKLGNASPIVRGAKVKALTQASMIFSTASKQKAPVDTGNLRRNIKYSIQSDGNQAELKADTEYAIHQEYGTGIYGRSHRMITPKKAKMLAWKDKGGKWIFARAVKGVRGKLFMKQGSEELIRRTRDVSNTLFNELQKGLI